MISGWQIDELVALVRERYPDWQDFSHPAFVADEIAPKRAAAALAREILGKRAFKELLAAAAYDGLIERLEQLGQATSLLWTAQPRRGDLALLYDERLNRWAFAEQMRALLYEKRPSPDRLASFGEYCDANDLPNRWPFPTYFLFLVRPHAEIFVKPSVARWYLKFMGMGDLYTPRPSAELYERLKKNWHGLLAEMKGAYGSTDMIDMQSLIWVAFAVSQERAGRLDYRGQIALDRPLPLGEDRAEYAAESNEIQPDPDSAPPAVGAADESTYLSLDAVEAATLIPRSRLADWIEVIERKKQAIFYGPPGTGKTFLARQLARHLAGEGDGLVEIVQFHPAFDYADFVEGIRPVTGPDGALSYENRPGVFLDFCRRAAGRGGRCVLIIDEINRAHLSRVFGEVMGLLDYRQESVTLASGRTLHIPGNVRLLGTMNTADRSIALIDHALRRRFVFIHLTPDFDLLRRWHRERTGLALDPLIELLEQLNREIGDDDYAVGISFFLQDDLADRLPSIWKMEIEPYLEELFYSRREVMDRYRWDTIRPLVDPARRPSHEADSGSEPEPPS